MKTLTVSRTEVDALLVVVKNADAAALLYRLRDYFAVEVDCVSVNYDGDILGAAMVSTLAAAQAVVARAEALEGK